MTEVIVLGAIIVAQMYMMWLRDKAYAKERADLLSRIQARDLPEYVAMTAPTVRPPQEPKEYYEQV